MGRQRHGDEKEIYWIIIDLKTSGIWTSVDNNAIFVFTSKDNAIKYIKEKNLNNSIPYQIELDILYDLYANERDYILINAKSAEREVVIRVLKKGKALIH